MSRPASQETCPGRSLINLRVNGRDIRRVFLPRCLYPPDATWKRFQEASMYQILIIVVALVCSAVSSEAQSHSGTVLDPQGAAVPKAEIKLYVRQDGGELKTTSDPKGRYR